MTNTLGKREKAILIGLAAEIEIHKTQSGNARVDYSHFRRVECAKKSTAAVNPSVWTGQKTTSSTSVMNGRSYKRLEAAGYVDRLNCAFGLQTTHLFLTEAGKIEAKRLAENETARK